ncbi:aldo/keto reductase [Streptomyces sp. x-80]|uniref:aldo/keto reductase n=1 Tax=Streptomyces sp. x-80 TaxID=2789282 RepID=UPI003981852C
MAYRSLGSSGLTVSVLSLYLAAVPTPRAAEAQRAALEHGHRRGINHFVLVQPPDGRPLAAAAPLNQLLRRQRDRTVLSVYAQRPLQPAAMHHGSRKHLRASLDHTLADLDIDYVDILYAHRYNPQVPLEETAAALAEAIQRGKALHAGVSYWPPAPARNLAALLYGHGIQLTAHHSPLSSHRPDDANDLLRALEGTGVGCLACPPRAFACSPPTPCVPEVPAAALDPAQRASGTARWDYCPCRHQERGPQRDLEWVLAQPTVTTACVPTCHPGCLDAYLTALPASR